MRALTLAIALTTSLGWSARPAFAATALAPASPHPVVLAQGSPVPEPSTLLLVGTGLVGVAVTARLRRRPR